MKKIIIVIILTITGVVTTCFAQKGSNENCLNDNVCKDNDNVIVVESGTEQESENEEIIEQDEKEIEQENVEEIIAQSVENSQTENEKVSENIATTNTNVVEKQTKKETEQVVIPKQTTIQENNSSVEEQSSNIASEEIKSELTENDLFYWCVEGGSHHVAGDGANEHGYYNSWDEAYAAFENYTKDWHSVQFKISQCLCGKFYFWVIE